jgi:hypothetical protein
MAILIFSLISVLALFFAYEGAISEGTRGYLNAAAALFVAFMFMILGPLVQLKFSTVFFHSVHDTGLELGILAAVIIVSMAAAAVLVDPFCRLCVQLERRRENK